MKRYIVIPTVISILGHGIFFSIFKISLPVPASVPRPRLYIISSGQIKHEMTKGILLTPLVSRLSKENPIWADTIRLSKGIEEIYREDSEETILAPLKNVRILQKLPLPEKRKQVPHEQILPRFSDLFYDRMPSEIVRGQAEQVISLANSIHLSYYIKGPVSDRGLQTVNFPLEAEKSPVELELRFWVAKNGSVNQVIIEKWSGFPIVDKKMIDALKQWRFTPVYTPKGPKYQWGIIKIRVQ